MSLVDHNDDISLAPVFLLLLGSCLAKCLDGDHTWGGDDGKQKGMWMVMVLLTLAKGAATFT